MASHRQTKHQLVRELVECLRPGSNTRTHDWAVQAAERQALSVSKDAVLTRLDSVGERMAVDGRGDIQELLEKCLEKLRGLNDSAVYETLHVLVSVRGTRQPFPFVFEYETGAVSQMTWEQIVAEEPLTGDIWAEEGFGESEDEDIESVQEGVQIAENAQENRQNTPKDGQNTPSPSFILHDEHMRVELIRELVDAAIVHTDTARSAISEPEMVRYVVSAALGHETPLFASTSARVSVVAGFLDIPGVSRAALRACLVEAAELCTICRRLASVENARADSHVRGPLVPVLDTLRCRLLGLEDRVLNITPKPTLLAVVMHLGTIVEPYQSLVQVFMGNLDQVGVLDSGFDMLQHLELECDLERFALVALYFGPVWTHFVQDLDQWLVGGIGYKSSLPRFMSHLGHDVLVCGRHMRLLDRLQRDLGKQKGIIESPVERKMSHESTMPIKNTQFIVDQVTALVYERLHTNSTILNDYLLKHCGLVSLIKAHLNLFFCQSAPAAEFMSMLVHVDQSRVDRHLVSDLLAQAGVNAVVAPNQLLALLIPNTPELLISADSMSLFQQVWTLLYRMRLARASGVGFDVSVLLASAEAYVHTYTLWALSTKLLASLADCGARSVLSLFETCMSNVRTALEPVMAPIEQVLDLCGGAGELSEVREVVESSPLKEMFVNNSHGVA